MKNDGWDAATAIKPPRDSDAELVAQSYVVSVVDGPDTGARIVIEATPGLRVLVGKGPACDLRLGDPLVSRRHASIEVTPTRLRVTDLESTNGTMVNGVPVDAAYVGAGDRVRVADTVLLVERGDAA